MVPLHTPAAPRQDRTPSRSPFLFARILVAALLVLCGGLLSASAATLTVGAGSGNNYQDLQLAINAAQPGDTIIVQAGETFYGSFVLKNKNTTSTAYITIQSSAVGSLPAGARVGPSQSSLMPHLVTQNYQGFTYGPPALKTEAGAHHYRLIGLDFTSVSTASIHEVVALGDGSEAQDTLAEVPHHLVLDRCLIRASASQAAKRGISLNSADTQIINSHVAGFKLTDDDSQAIAMWNGPGPYEITNNYLEGAAENILILGSSNWIPNLIPSDVTIRGNHITKPLAWQGTWRVKNLLELKTGKRVTIEGNLFEYSWQSGGDGNALVIACIGNGSGAVPQLEDIIVRSNIIRHAASGISLDGKLGATDGSYMRRVRIENNLFEDITADWGDTYGRLFIVNDATDEVTIEHNTAFNSGRAVHSDVAGNTDFVFRNNIVHGNVATGLNNPGDQPLNANFPGAVWTKNVQVEGGPVEYYDGTYSTPAHTGNDFPAAFSNVGFVDYAGGNYRLLSTSWGYHNGTDGKDVGVDISALEAAMGNRYSLSLDGVDDYVNVPAGSGSSLNLTGPLTLEAWVKYTPNGTYQTIISKESYGLGSGGGGYTLQITNTGKLRMTLFQSHTAYVDTIGVTTVSSGVWHHVAGVFDGSQRRLYLDGVLDKTVTGTTAPASGTADLKLGRRASASQYHFDGLIDEVRISSGALYSSNFAPETSPSIVCGTTVGLWKFDGQTVDDATGDNNPNTLTGGSYSADVPTGDVEHSLSLNGTDAYLSVANNSTLNFTGAVTLEAWIKYSSNGTYQTIVAKESFGLGSGGGGYTLQITNTGKLRMLLFQSHTAYVDVVGLTTVTTGVWHHVAGVFDGSQRRLYLDGVLDKTVTGTSAPASGTATLTIGRRSSGAQYYVNGLVDEVRLSSGALYSSNFTPERNLTPTCGTTKALWKFDGQVYNDASGNSNTGSPQGTTAFSTDVP